MASISLHAMEELAIFDSAILHWFLSLGDPYKNQFGQLTLVSVGNHEVVARETSAQATENIKPDIADSAMAVDLHYYSFVVGIREKKANILCFHEL